MSFFKRLFCVALVIFGVVIGSLYAAPPSFENDFAKHLTDGEPDSQWNIEKVYDLNIDPDRTLFANLRRFFYPDVGGQWGQLWEYIRIIGVWIFFIFLVWIGIQFLLNGDDEAKLWEARQHLMFLLYGAFLYFGAVWILGVALNIASPWGSIALVNNFQNNLWFQLLAFFKSLAFFAAIIALVVAWYRMMSAMDSEDKLKAARNGIVNVLIALVLLKVVDFVYLLAQDATLFSQAKSLIIRISKILWYAIGVGMLASVFVSGYLYITDGWSGEWAKKAKNIFQTVFIVGLTIFLFLLIVYQVIAQFG